MLLRRYGFRWSAQTWNDTVPKSCIGRGILNAPIPLLDYTIHEKHDLLLAIKLLVTQIVEGQILPEYVFARTMHVKQIIQSLNSLAIR